MIAGEWLLFVASLLFQTHECQIGFSSIRLGEPVFSSSQPRRYIPVDFYTTERRTGKDGFE
jgi:hypothetical protein